MEGALPAMFTHVKEKLPSEEGLYVCRCIDKKTGAIKYRVDEYRRPSVFQEKYEGIEEGFQLDFGSSIITQAWAPLDDDYENHIIDLSNDNNKTHINIDGYEMCISLGEITEDECISEEYNINVYTCPMICTYKNEVYTNMLKIFKSTKTGHITISWKDIDPMFKIIKNCNDITLKDYIENRFYYSLKVIFEYKISMFNNSK